MLSTGLGGLISRIENLGNEQLVVALYVVIIIEIGVANKS
jgi:hypothetical protein